MLTQVGLGVGSDRVIIRLVEVVEDGAGMANDEIGLKKSVVSRGK